MKYDVLFLITALCLFIFSAKSQNANARINGIIENIQGLPMDGATVILLQTDDSSKQKRIITNESGRFVFKSLQKNNYHFVVSFAGYKKYTSNTLIIDKVDTSLMLPLVVLQLLDNAVLQTVTVTTSKKLIEQKSDRTIVNVDTMITAAGSNALEVLTKSPGVMVDMNGNIRLNGKNGVLVLIDDKPTYMSVQDLADYLKSLPAAILDKIELMSNPPAKYDASGNAIINIVLKKNRATGFNGSISEAYNQGVYARTNSSLNVNYRNKKFNIFGNLSYSGNKNFTTGDDSRYFYNKDETLNAAVLVNNKYRYRSHAWNARAGADYFVSPKTTLGVMFIGNVRPKTDQLNYTSNQYEQNMKLDSTSTGYTSGDYHWKNYSINLNLQHKVDTAGQKLTTDIDYIGYNSNSEKFSSNYVYLPDGSLANSYGLLFKMPSNVNIWSLKTDYTLPIKGNLMAEAGFKSSYVINNSRFYWFNQSGNTFIPDYGKSDHFIYSENINAAYLTVAKEWKHWAIKGGLRLENTRSKGDQPGNMVIPDSAFGLNYISLFPSFYALYKLDSSGNNTLTLSYSHRIRRPGYQQLNPFLFYNDRYTYATGNPNLSSEYGNFLELRYNYKQNLGVTFSYGNEKYLIYPTTQAVGDLLITRPQNFSSRHFIGVIPNISLSPAKWWSLNANAVVLFFVNKSQGENVTLLKNTNMHEVELFNQFHFMDGWSGELTGFFPGRQTFGQSQGEPVYNISAGIQKVILGKQGAIRLKVDDIFHTMSPAVKIIGIKQVTAFHSGNSDTRQIGLSFSYRFGKEANARKRNHNAGGAADEEKRAN